MSSESAKDEWKKPERYVPSGPGAPVLPPQLSDFKYTNVDEFVTDLKKMPFFMTQLDDDEDNEELQALKAMTYEGEPHEIAENFKIQGNDAYKVKDFKNAIEYYTQALAVELGSSSDTKIEDLDQREKELALLKAIKVACYSNRAACNLELRNYRRCINDCKSALMLDPTHAKSAFRAGKAYLATEHIGEALEILHYGQTLFPESKDAENAKPVQLQAIDSLLETVLKRQKTLEELEAKRKAAAQLKETKKRNLQFALDAHNFTVLMTSNAHNEEDSGNDNSLLPDDTKIQLQDPLNPASDLYLPILFLYPLEMQSDIIQQAETTSVVNDHILQLFESPPPWFAQKPDEHPRDYQVKNLVVYAQTRAGGLVKVGKNSTVGKVLSLKSPQIPIIDGVARFYIVPKNRAEEWLSTWNKDQAKRMLNIN